jgi:hypothetical protein
LDVHGIGVLYFDLMRTRDAAATVDMAKRWKSGKKVDEGGTRREKDGSVAGNFVDPA